MTLIAVSSCAMRGRSFAEMERLALAHDWIVEFSSGFRFEPGLDEQFVNARCKRWIHNYFPPPEKPFVLNLASLRPEAWQASVDHGRRAISLAHRAGVPFYSIHAGFCIDPDVKDLGQPLIRYKSEAPRETYWARFVQGVKELMKDADRCGIDLYVENNVVSADNVNVPLLCADAAECSKLVQAIANPRFGILLDTGHVKVSAKSLGFNPDRMVEELQPVIRALHHSDNDGAHDTNVPCDSQYWFLKHMPRFRSAAHVLEIVDLTPDQIKDQTNLLTRAL